DLIEHRHRVHPPGDALVVDGDHLRLEVDFLDLALERVIFLAGGRRRLRADCDRKHERAQHRRHKRDDSTEHHLFSFFAAAPTLISSALLLCSGTSMTTRSPILTSARCAGLPPVSNVVFASMDSVFVVLFANWTLT